MMKRGIEFRFGIDVRGMIERGEYVEPHLLAGEMFKRYSAGPVFRLYLYRYHLGQVTLGKGRPKRPEWVKYRIAMYYQDRYSRYLKWLQARLQRNGKPTRLAKAWKSGEPHVAVNEVAARMTAQFFDGFDGSWRRIQNAISSLR